MLRSLYSGVSGLQNHQVRMDVLGNNISNVNTTGFKKGRVNFQDMLSQTMSGAAKPTDEVGGVNPRQVGLGMIIASIDTIHTQGSLQTTGVLTDVALQGNGFFILKDGDKSFYTRNGAFSLDQNGYLVNPANGQKVQGWLARTVGGQTIVNTSSALEDLVVPVGSKDPAFATTEVKFASNLDKRVEPLGPTPTEAESLQRSWVSSFDIYDSFGRAHMLQVTFSRVEGIENRWRAVVEVDPGAEVGTNTVVEIPGSGNASNIFYLDFDNNGALQSILDDAGGEVAGDNVPALARVYFDVPESDITPEGTAYRQEFSLNLGDIGSYRNTITQFGDLFSTKMIEQNGHSMGYLETFKIDQQGVITGVYSNGTNRTLGQIALAHFTNPGGLEKAGENTYVVSNNSGEARVGTSGVEGRGRIISGALEMSNVDLAEQFTDMIVTQRGFQANSRTITTSDQMLQELLTLKR
ncbi:MAG: flagellar hook protein FlgE [Spirochaetales bacterium]|nr:flagellar hook protein FlgE [Spirochaetales bacterium]